jgi:hypothetical protein
MPTTHHVTDGSANLFPNYFGIPFTVPASDVIFAVTSTTGDTFNAGIFTAADWAVYSTGGAGTHPWAVHSHTSTAQDNINLAAGSYVLGLYCTNVIQRCSAGYAIDALY